MFKFTVIAAVLCVVSHHALAISGDEINNIRSATLPFVIECAKEHGTSLAEQKARPEAGKLSEIDGCLLACVAKKTGSINDAGLYVPRVAIENTSKYLSDPADIAKTTEIANSCASVNMQAVTDGAKGCERAKLLKACLDKNKD